MTARALREDGQRAACRWRAGSLLLTAALLLPAPARADPASRTEGGEEPYADRLIADGALEPETSVIDDTAQTASGNPRSLVVELGGSRIAPRTSIEGVDTSRLDRVQEEVGLSVSGRYQTDNYGLLGIDAQLRRGVRSGPFGSPDRPTWSGSGTVTSKGLPLGEGWLADSALGIVATPAIDLMRRQTRFFLPSTSLLGGSLSLDRYRRLAPGQTGEEPRPYASFHLSAGQPGLLGGMRLADFTGLSGLSVSGGGQVELSGQWKAGVQAIAVRDARDPYAVILQEAGAGGEAPQLSSTAALGTVAFASGDLRVQANGIWSRRRGTGVASDLSDPDGAAGGGWLDASYRDGRTAHSGGLYYLAPGLVWGASAVLNNAYGGYYRFSTSSQRWRWTVNLDAVNSVDGRTGSGVIASADVRRKLTFDTLLGVNSMVRVANGQTSVQVLGFLDFLTDLGSSRAEAGWGHDPASQIYRIGFNQNWALGAWLPAGSHLSTQVSFDHRRQTEPSAPSADGEAQDKSNNVAAAVSLGATPRSWINLDATVAYNSSASSATRAGYGPLVGGAAGPLSSRRGEAFSATVVATARLSGSLSLTGSYTDTTSNLTSRFGLPDPGSPLGALAFAEADARRSTFRLKAGYVTLRYAIAAGRRNGSLGLREYPVGGTGNLEGRVFLDANDSRTREPAEAGVAGIVVILDGIQAVRTDAGGYYRFEGVADGPHVVTVNADALPLPWTIEPDDKRGTGEPYVATIDVGVRSTVRLDIPAGRD